MNKTLSAHLEQEKLLYKLIIQFLIFCQGSNALLEPHLLQVGKRLKAGASMNELSSELQAMSKTLLHISKQAAQNPSQTNSALNYDHMLQCIDGLLEKADVPRSFQQKKAALQQKIKTNTDEQSFNMVIDTAVTLLLDIRDQAICEQNSIDEFLLDMSSQLGQIEQHVEHVGESTRLSIGHRQQLNAEINLQVDSIKDSTHQVQELAILKTLTSDHLDRLMQHLIEHKTSEDERQKQAEQQIALMTEKLQALETETESLRNKLKIENDRALRDVLTGLPNRLACKDRMELEAKRWNRYRKPLTLVIWDIDHFKRINDKYGHKAGDKTLALVGQLLQKNIRETDFVARYGGEEFVMLMPNTQASQALKMADNIRALIEHSGFNYNAIAINLTLSCGICEFAGDDLHDDVFVRADSALYQAKQSGRNRCGIYKPG